MIGKLLGRMTSNWRLDDAAVAKAMEMPSMVEQIEALSVTPIYRLKLGPELADLRDRALWRHRAAAAHDWLGYSTLLNLPMIAANLLLNEEMFYLGVLLHLGFMPIAFCLSMTAWTSPRPSWAEGLSVIGFAFCLMLLAYALGVASGGEMQERYLAAVFMVILTAIAVIPLADRWVVALAVFDCAAYVTAQSFNPRVDPTVILFMTLFFVCVCAAVVLARITANRVQTRSVILAFRDRYRVRQLREINDHLQMVAMTDALTGAGNRRKLALVAEEALRDRMEGLYWLAVDLDGFKAVNDTWGHDAGDQVLSVACRRIAELVGPQGFVARIGGDEFVVLFAGSSAQAGALRHRITERLADPIALERSAATIGASVGLTAIQPGDTVDAIARRADESMYAQKRSRRAA